jgi:beta-D-xylosidase 4
MHFSSFGSFVFLYVGSVHALVPREKLSLTAGTRICLPEYAANTTFLGCFTDNADERTLNGTQLGDSEENTPQNCANQCGLAGYVYSGVEYTVQCFCSNQLPIDYGSISGTQVNVSQCDSPCPGNTSEFCGAGGR